MCISTGAINPKFEAHFGFTGSLDQWDLDHVLAEFDIDGSEYIEKSEFARLYSLVHISPLEAAPGSLEPIRIGMSLAHLILLRDPFTRSTTDGA